MWWASYRIRRLVCPSRAPDKGRVSESANAPSRRLYRPARKPGSVIDCPDLYKNLAEVFTSKDASSRRPRVQFQRHIIRRSSACVLGGGSSKVMLIRIAEISHCERLQSTRRETRQGYVLFPCPRDVRPGRKNIRIVTSAPG